MQECKAYCAAGNQPGCTYNHPTLGPLSKCSVCQIGCQNGNGGGSDSPQECSDGCDAMNWEVRLSHSSGLQCACLFAGTQLITGPEPIDCQVPRTTAPAPTTTPAATTSAENIFSSCRQCAWRLYGVDVPNGKLGDSRYHDSLGIPVINYCTL